MRHLTVFGNAFALLTAAAVLGALQAGCAVKTTDGDSDVLGTQDSALVEDDGEASEVETDAEAGMEDPLSGAEAADPLGTAGSAETDAELRDRMAKNPGRFFTPAGCIVTTVDPSANSATSVFTNCVGPYNRRTYNGTVVTTWSRAAGKLTVKHDAVGFRIDAATVEHHATITYEKSAGTLVRTRQAQTTGTTKKGKALSRSVTMSTVFDPASRCTTRDGSAETTVGDRTHSRTVTGLKVCGNRFACPTAGTIVLQRKNGDSVTLSFDGAAAVSVSSPRLGRPVRHALQCLAAQAPAPSTPAN